MTRSHGTGEFRREQFAHIGEGVVIEPGVLVFHPEHIELGDGVYVGHQTILKGYHINRMIIGEGVWIGQQCFLHSAGGIRIGKRAALGPGTKILTSTHELDGAAALDMPIRDRPLVFAAVEIEEGADIGVGAILLPGVRIGRCAQVGAGAVVVASVPDYAIVGGVPARVLRTRAG